jgi:hypothetical protein
MNPQAAIAACLALFPAARLVSCWPAGSPGAADGAWMITVKARNSKHTFSSSFGADLSDPCDQPTEIK